jgi:hypothetical protein
MSVATPEPFRPRNPEAAVGEDRGGEAFELPVELRPAGEEGDDDIERPDHPPSYVNPGGKLAERGAELSRRGAKGDPAAPA